jgi:hypothetical protein
MEELPSNLPRGRPPLQIALAGSSALLAAVVFSLPPLLLLAGKGYYLPFSAESLVYRYFGSVRILAGQGRTVFLPQGQLITSIQNGIVGVLQCFPKLGLQQTLELFSGGTTLVVNVAMLGVYLATCFDRSLTVIDKAIVLVLGPATILGTVAAGFYYTLLPDYYALDLPIVSGSVYLALRCLRTSRPCRMIDVLTIGALTGIAATNKLTLLGPMGVVALLVIAREPVTLPRFVVRTGAAILACVTGYLLVFSSAYLFSIPDTIQALRYSFRFFDNAGGEPNFWETNFRIFLRGYGYAHIFTAWVIVTLFFATAIVWLKKRRGTILLFANLLVAGLLAAGLLKRGAGTTLFEASTILAGLVALMLAAGLGLFRPSRWMLTIPACLALAAASQFDYEHNWFVVKKGGEIGRTVWRARNYALQFHQPIVAIIPDRSYFTGSVEEFLQTAFFLSGYAPPGPRLSDRFIAQTQFRTEPGLIQSGTTVVWLEKSDPITKRPLKETNRTEAARWSDLTRLATINPSMSWRAGYSDLGIIHVVSVIRLK